MIVVTIDLHSAITGKRKRLGRMVIANDATPGNPKRGDYEVRVAHQRDVNKPPRDWMGAPHRHGRVKDYPRLSYNVWRLVARALLSAFPEENTK